MAERGILFSAPMVRALLSGAKTQTRRLTHWRPQCPYGFPGDRLWVRETWAHDADSLEDLRAMVEDIVGGSDCGPYYRADGVHENSGLRWRPSIHMPRWCSRITLEITDVRVQQLQDITEDDARAEGVTPEPGKNHGHVGAFCDLWESINGKRSTWASNPWVWAISFRRVDQGAERLVANG